MKFATLANGSRDGQLLLVSRDLERMLPVPEIAPTLQALLDDWPRLSPLMAGLYDALCAGEYRGDWLPY
ncbi:MAG: hypothetical protein EPO48_03435, partial [Nevskiaceae bacterium]